MRDSEKSSSQEEHKNKANENSLISEVHVLKTALEGERKKSEEQLCSILQERDDALRKVEEVEDQLERQKAASRSQTGTQDQTVRSLKAQVDRLRRGMDEKEKDSEELERMRKKLSSVKTQLAKSKAVEKKLREDLIEKENQLEEERVRATSQAVQPRANRSDALKKSPLQQHNGTARKNITSRRGT